MYWTLSKASGLDTFENLTWALFCDSLCKHLVRKPMNPFMFQAALGAFCTSPACRSSLTGADSWYRTLLVETPVCGLSVAGYRKQLQSPYTYPWAHGVELTNQYIPIQRASRTHLFCLTDSDICLQNPIGPGDLNEGKLERSQKIRTY